MTTSTLTILKSMLERVAKALGPELCEKMTFVGGCTTGLLVTDEYSKEQVRHTDDVDLIVSVIGWVGFNSLQEQLKGLGFKIAIPDPGEEPPICAMMLEDLRVDFMPDDNSIGFTNIWYKLAMETATQYKLTEETTIQLVSPVYFIATKLEAYLGRGKSDALASRDIEDILHLIDGREELINEIENSDDAVKAYIATQISALLSDPNFEYAIESQSQGNAERTEIIFERLEVISSEK